MFSDFSSALNAAEEPLVCCISQQRQRDWETDDSLFLTCFGTSERGPRTELKEPCLSFGILFFSRGNILSTLAAKILLLAAGCAHLLTHKMPIHILLSEAKAN